MLFSKEEHVKIMQQEIAEKLALLYILCIKQ